MNARAQEIRKVFEESIAELRAALNPADRSYIMAWDNGLGVGFVEGKNPYACGLLNAEVFDLINMPEEAQAYMPNIVNGNKEPAMIPPRQRVLARELARLEEILADHLAYS